MATCADEQHPHHEGQTGEEDVQERRVLPHAGGPHTVRHLGIGRKWHWQS